ncbi:MAG TPA: hypothetical protein VNE61_06165 [Ktedonobacteraceae bacterium]|nr:hypothetical protein [Ktedonobacteraceae bacterium]
MTFMALADCCRHLGVDPKTLRRWLTQAQFPLQPHPGDGREKGITTDQLRLLATAHHRSLPSLPGAQPSPAPAQPAPEPSPLPADLLELLQYLRAVPAQLASMQQQLAALTARLEPPPLPPPATASQARQGARGTARSLPATGATSSRPSAPRARSAAHVIPRVEYSGEGHYVVICPQRGVLPFEPDSLAWFAWLDSVSSFRFVGKAGHFTAHHESLRVPHGSWRAHRNIRNHTRILRLAHSHNLTIAVLEQTAAALQAHLS